MIISVFLFYRRVIINKQTQIIIIIFFITIIQSAYSPSISGSRSSFVSQVFGYLWIFFAYQILYKSKSFEKTNSVIIYSSFFPLALGLYQWIMYKSTGRVPALPFGFLISSQGKLGLTYNVYVRITSCFGDPAYMTTFFVGVFTITLQQMMSNTKKGIKGAFKIVYCSIIIILIVVETIMSISVSGVVGLLVGLILCLILNMDKIKKFRRVLFVIAILSVALLLYFINSGSELIDILQYKMKNSSQTYANMYGRSEYIKNGLNVWAMNPFFGGGFGSLSINGSFSSAHSSLLTVLCQQGIIVFILNLIALIIFPIKTWNKIKKTDNEDLMKFYIGPFCGLLSILALTLGYDTLYSLDFCYVMIAVVSSYGYLLFEKNK